MVEDAGIRLIERGWSWFGVRDGFGCRRDDGVLGSELNTTGWM
jgi:hypothetical protein